MKVNYHSCKGLRKRGHRFKTHGTVHGAGSGRIQAHRLRCGRRITGIPSPPAAQGVHYHPRTGTCKSRTPRVFHGRKGRKAAYIHFSRLNHRASRSIKRDNSATWLHISRLQRCRTAVERSGVWWRRQARNPTFNSTEFYQSRDSDPSSTSSLRLGSSPRDE